jgi:hypothetical protein
MQVNRKVNWLFTHLLITPIYPIKAHDCNLLPRTPKNLRHPQHQRHLDNQRV